MEAEGGGRLQLLSNSPNSNPSLHRLVVKSGGSTRFIPVADIDWIEAAGGCANLHIAGKQLLYRNALNDLAERLDPLRFVRVHRSAIVNIESILRLDPISHGEFEIVLKDGSQNQPNLSPASWKNDWANPSTPTS